MGSPKPPKPTDPQQIIDTQRGLRTNTASPFGEQTWGTGPDGRDTLTTSYSPEMQGLADRAIRLAGQDSQRFENPAWMTNMENQIANRAGERYTAPGGAKAGGGGAPVRPQRLEPAGTRPGGIVQSKPMGPGGKPAGPVSAPGWAIDLPGGQYGTKPPRTQPVMPIIGPGPGPKPGMTKPGGPLTALLPDMGPGMPYQPMPIKPGGPVQLPYEPGPGLSYEPQPVLGAELAEEFRRQRPASLGRSRRMTP